MMGIGGGHAKLLTLSCRIITPRNLNLTVPRVSIIADQPLITSLNRLKWCSCTDIFLISADPIGADFALRLIQGDGFIDAHHPMQFVFQFVFVMGIPVAVVRLRPQVIFGVRPA